MLAFVSVGQGIGAMLLLGAAIDSLWRSTASRGFVPRAYGVMMFLLCMFSAGSILWVML